MDKIITLPSPPPQKRRRNDDKYFLETLSPPPNTALVGVHTVYITDRGPNACYILYTKRNKHDGNDTNLFFNLETL
jgi:hypothetical protein